MINAPLPAVVVEDVTKTFVVGPRRTLRGALARRAAQGRVTTVALDAVSLTVEHGEALAIVGANGAGKTTLLRLVAGVGRPDRGRIDVDGRATALLELGLGFHPDCTGRESAVLGSIVGGATRREAERRLPEIIEFSGLARVIDQPMRTYSSGMKARLAFAVAARDDVGVLIVDEALAVGDLAFRERCIERISALRREGVSLVLATHELELAAALCDRAVWLSAGRVVAEGSAAEIGDRYREGVHRAMVEATPALPVEVATRAGGTLRMGENRWGSQDVVVSDVVIADAAGQSVTALGMGAPLRVSLALSAPEPRPINVAISVLDEHDGVCIDLGTAVELVGGTQVLEAEITRVDLVPGRYRLDVGAYDEHWEQRLDYHHAAYPFEVLGPRGRSGMVAPPILWRLDPRTTGDTPAERTGEGGGWRPTSSMSS